MEISIEEVEKYNEFLKKEGYVPTIDLLIEHMKALEIEAELREESDTFDGNNTHQS